MNYHPISLLPHFGNGLETLINLELVLNCQNALHIKHFDMFILILIPGEVLIFVIHGCFDLINVELLMSLMWLLLL